LDSLAGEFVDASLGLLPRGGRFVEMGKADVRDVGEIAQTYPGVVYRAFDLMDAGPERIREMLGELVGLFGCAAIEPLPVRAWDMRHAPEAFRYMSQARHVGKIVLTLPAGIDVDGTVLVTGGTGSLGALLARHLVLEHGVAHLLLASRGGLQAHGACELQAELEALGACVRIAACDVSDRDQLEALLESVASEHPLCGVVHAAGVLEDGMIESLTAQAVERVMAPKADAAWYLHELTEHLNLGVFALFSSAAGVLGSPGQANYAAANTFLDALAAHRRARGLPATSIAWGLWQQPSGMGSHLTEVDFTRMARSGMIALSPGEGLELFNAAFRSSDTLTVGTPLDLGRLRRRAASGLLPTILSGLVSAPTRRAVNNDAGSIARRLANSPREDHARITLTLVRAEAAKVLGHLSPDSIDTERSFKELGFDSLTAVELRNRLNLISGLRLPATLTYDYPTVSAVADHLLTQIAGASSSQTSASRELEKLETILCSIAEHDTIRDQVAARLRAFLLPANDTEAPAGGATAAEKIDSASDDELFTYLDEKIYASPMHQAEMTKRPDERES
jgi:polyketide synthase 12